MRAADETEQVQDPDGAALGEAERHEPVRHVVGAALRGLAPASRRSTRTNAVSKSGTIRISTTITAGLMNASGAL